jgi:hypothetical protein
MKTRKKIDGPPASREFTDTLNGGGGVFIDCGACGREHHAIDSAHYSDEWSGPDHDEETRRLALLNRAKEDPDGVVLHYDCDSVYYLDIDSRVIPVECPCNSLRQYENFFWKNRKIWRTYMANMEKKIADDLASVSGIIMP